MLNLKLKERRLNTRKTLTGLLPGKLIHQESEELISCRPVDISKDGVGVLSEVDLTENSIVIEASRWRYRIESYVEETRLR